MLSRNQNGNLKKRKIRVVMKSFPGCEPCMDIRKEVKKLGKRPDLDIEFVEVKVGAEELDEIDNPEHPINKFFGADKKDYAPITIIESPCKSKRIEGYSDGDIIKAIEEVKCDGDEGEESGDQGEEE